MYCFKGSFTVFLTTLRPRKTCSRRSKSLDQQSVFTKHVASSYVNLLEQKKIFGQDKASTPTGPVCRVGTLFLTINSRTFEGHSRLHFPFFKDSIQCKNELWVYVFFSSSITWVILSRGSFCVCSFLFGFLLKLWRYNWNWRTFHHRLQFSRTFNALNFYFKIDTKNFQQKHSHCGRCPTSLVRKGEHLYS